MLASQSAAADESPAHNHHDGVAQRRELGQGCRAHDRGRILRSIAPEYKISDDALWRNPTMQEVIDTDPSEAIRSALIPQLLRVYFDVKWERGFGGGLLHPLFQRLNEHALAAKDVGVDTMINMLIEIERILEDCNAIPSDFVLGVAQQKAV